MSKKLLQDMVKKPTRPDVRLNKSFGQDPGRLGGVKKEQASKKVWYSDAEAKPSEPDNNVNIKRGRNKNGSRYGLWGVALVSVLFLLFSYSFLFSGATVTVSPRIEELVLNQNFSAIKDGAAGDLPFDLVVISGEESKNVEGGEEIDVSLKAEGIVVIYNAFSSANQRLNIDTRLEGSNGKIYKTKVATVVPGMKDNVPGSVEVEIYGAESSVEYNSIPLDFKIFGFKGTPKYAKFYARSKGDIKGGFAGKQRQISDVEKTKLLNELKTTLEAELSKKATDQIPSGFILFKNATYLNIDEENFNSTNSSALDSNVVPVGIKGTLYGILFEEKALTQKIIEKSFPDEKENEIYIQNIRDLTFSLPAGIDFSGFADAKKITFNLSGTSNAIWKVDEDKLLGDLLGKKKKDFNQILAQYLNIISANLSFHPFWRRSLPDEKEDIKLLVNYPE